MVRFKSLDDADLAHLVRNAALQSMSRRPLNHRNCSGSRNAPATQSVVPSGMWRVLPGTCRYNAGACTTALPPWRLAELHTTDCSPSRGDRCSEVAHYGANLNADPVARNTGAQRMAGPPTPGTGVPILDQISSPLYSMPRFPACMWRALLAMHAIGSAQPGLAPSASDPVPLQSPPKKVLERVDCLY